VWLADSSAQEAEQVDFARERSEKVASLVSVVAKRDIAFARRANSVYDLSETTIPLDEVSDRMVVRPRRWNTDMLRKFMLVFGPLSSIFDFLTFGLLLVGFHAGEALFHTGWFVESLATQVLVIFNIWTARPLRNARIERPWRARLAPSLRARPSTIRVRCAVLPNA
jgi:P-type Mg2+ transporter